ncbi:MAG: CsgG/HfaB family protein, partial [Spirochaetaceae bacterium]|nr:CsgG/HfaB family protein [Spirochaetaceae bacterium]
MRTTKRLFTALLFAITAVILGAAGGQEPRQEEAALSDGLPLDEGIKQAARDIEAALPEGTRVAAVNFKSPSAYFSDYLLEELQSIFVSDRKLVVAERSQLELLRNEVDFQMSGEVSDDGAASLGKWVGAQVIITGSLTDIGDSYRLRFNAIDVETAV